MWTNVQVSSGCPAPSSRSKHAICVAENGFIYLLGGRSANLPLKDLWKFDPVQSVWEEVRTRGNRPPCLQEHTMVSWKNMLYVFGGEIGFASTGETPLWILDLGALTWRKHHVRGMSSHQPSGRRGHTAVIYDGTMHVYGGYQDLRGSSSELWTFDLATERWHLILVPSHLEQPSPRHNHSCGIHDGAMWIYGGQMDLLPKGDFWRWDFVIHEWTRLKAPKSPGDLYGHAAVTVMAHMYIFGGERTGVALNELWRYHFATETWERINAEGIIPQPRCRHVAVANPSLRDSSKIQSWSDTGQREEKPPKSASMNFGQAPENGRKHFKFRVHPVSRLCSKSTSSDEDDEEEYTISYNQNATQVNLRSLRDKISSSRLVRSISSGSYSILHNQSANEGRHDELEKLVEEGNDSQQHRLRTTIQKSQSSDAVLESDSESTTPRHQQRPESLIEQSTHSPPIWVENHNSSLCPSAWSDGHQQHGHHSHHHRPVAPSSGRATTNDHHCTTPSIRPGRLAYDGPLSTVRDVEEETSENADEANMVDSMPAQNGCSNSGRCAIATEMLVDLDIPETDHARYSNRFTSSYTISDLTSQTTTPSIESRGMPHSVSHSSGYHSFTDDEGGFDCHREFAGCLNTSNGRKMSRGRDLELKTFTPTHQPQTPTEGDRCLPQPPHCKERARSWDRSYQRRQVRSYPSGGSVTPTTVLSYGVGEDSLRDQAVPRLVQANSLNVGPNNNRESHNRRWSRSPAKQRPAQHQWNLCLYMFGGREQGAPGVYRQPISIWKLYV